MMGFHDRQNLGTHLDHHLEFTLYKRPYSYTAPPAYLREFWCLKVLYEVKEISEVAVSGCN